MENYYKVGLKHKNKKILEQYRNGHGKGMELKTQEGWIYIGPDKLDGKYIYDNMNCLFDDNFINIYGTDEDYKAMDNLDVLSFLLGDLYINFDKDDSNHLYKEWTSLLPIETICELENDKLKDILTGKIYDTSSDGFALTYDETKPLSLEYVANHIEKIEEFAKKNHVSINEIIEAYNQGFEVFQYMCEKTYQEENKKISSDEEALSLKTRANKLRIKNFIRDYGLKEKSN